MAVKVTNKQENLCTNNTRYYPNNTATIMHQSTTPIIIKYQFNLCTDGVLPKDYFGIKVPQDY